MDLSDELIQAIIENFAKEKELIALGTSASSEAFLKKLALKAELENKTFRIVPTCFHLAAVASSLRIDIAKPDENIDLAIEFASVADKNFNFIKSETHSLVRDKIIAKMAEELLVIVDKKNYVNRINGIVPFEISKFAFNLTVAELESFGEAELRMRKGKPFTTESGHFIVDVKLSEIHSLEDVDLQARMIPGVLETGLFLGYADKLLLFNGKNFELRKKAEGKIIKSLE